MSDIGNVEQILHDVYAIRSEYASQHKKAYNIFDVLEISDREVLMCRVLADFLNPRGQHNKGAKFLSIFLKDILHKDNADTICQTASVFKEYLIEGDRRIDIVIKANDVFIPIEVKINAGEQKAQCYDYYCYAKKKVVAPQVIYLTKFGDMPSEYSLKSSGGKDNITEADVHCISFSYDICRFMDLIVDSENDDVIIDIAKQYKKAIEGFTMGIDKELQDKITDKLLETKYNFETMLAIEQAAKAAKSKVIYSLMQEFEEQMKAVCEKTFGDKYRLELDTRFPDENVYKKQAYTYYTNSRSYPGINYVVKDISLPNGNELWFRIEVWQRLFAGLCIFDATSGKECEFEKDDWNKPTKNETIRALRGLITTDKEYDTTNWWYEWWYLPTGEYDEKTVSDSVPNFRDINDAAINLCDEQARKDFVKDSITIIEKKLTKIFGK